MLSIQESREELSELAEGMSDERVVEFRDTLYTIVDNLIDDYIAECLGER